MIDDTQLRTGPRTQEEFEAMRKGTERRAFSVALNLTRNPVEAEDLVQDTYLKAWRGFDSYMPGRPFLNWLLRIMQRAYLDQRRRENPIRKADSLNAMVSPNDGEVQEIPIADEARNAEEILLMEEFSAELRNSLTELPTVYRSAIVLCDVEGLSYEEIAERQKTTIGTVRSRIHRGRKLLREIVQKKGLTIPVR
ncbi:MAG: sigma-70 family RNA polymerase sigma factor [Fimbriimonadaceae bacterium]|nr:sigma-70 family RNA polymerase sigma factor [Fimbriimonadaceae bacterium]QYK55941.1 MAG: sigma-70 family RNA polymerase sigma factor [Fimbriimonadaceae bacterium]